MATLVAVEDGTSITFDGILKETWEFSGKVTDHPVEEFDFVIDNRQRNPNTLDIEAVVTRARFYPEDPQSRFDFLADTKSFLEFYSRSSLFTYTSVRLGVVENLMIEDFSFEIDNVERIEFNIRFKEVVFATSSFVDLPPVKVRRQEPVVKDCIQPGNEVLYTPVQGQATPTKEVSLRSIIDTLLPQGSKIRSPSEFSAKAEAILNSPVPIPVDFTPINFTPAP